jgi:hypothetical protein
LTQLGPHVAIDRSWHAGCNNLAAHQTGCNKMMTLRSGFQWHHLFSSVHTGPAVRTATNVSTAAQRIADRARPTRNGEAGQSIIEFALVFMLFLILVLGGIDLAWDVNQKSNFDYVVTQTSTCVATYNCDWSSLSATTASGLGLNPANLNLTVGGTVVTATYQGVSLTHFLPAITFNATVTAPCIACLGAPPA